ncbi:MAG: pirin [Azospirillum brasilense]|nr:MAG: pirin [Azospirillum brasilense]
MGDLHRLVLMHGRERARDMVPAQQRRHIDVAAEILADEAQDIGITYSGFCLTAFPHKRLPDDAPWEKKGHGVTLLVEPGRLKVGQGPSTLFGVPFGARARMVLFYLQTQAVRTQSREVMLGRSMRDWMTRMDMPIGGESMRALRDQARRISACQIKFFWTSSDQDGRASADGFERGAIVRSGLFFREHYGEDGVQGSLFEDKVTLDEAFYAALSEHPVPLLESAIRQLSNQSLALDIYVWLAYRLHALGKPTPISWTSLHLQFGTGFKLQRQFRAYFIDALGAAAAAYPDARIEVGESGVILHPSRPPVAKLA